MKQDHLEEIFNKWRLLDDDIWCKLIIMERNRRIGKAYARVPIVTIDGSHELSYDGYKLALNGFDNPDRDAKTEECRKRIGKGIRIKMDNFGNILIKRLSKSGVFVKEWLQSGSSASGSSNGRLMPSRQQLIKNQNAMLAAMSGPQGRAQKLAGSSASNSMTPSGSSSSGGSSLELPNDSAICDEVLTVGGRLDQDKIYVMFDMKKFQANITQELCRAAPDKRKLEQQCFSIVGLAKDADEILDLPCWVMVINIVAIEMLNERFPLMGQTSFPDTMLLEHSNQTSQRRAPNFVSIFDRKGGAREPAGAKEEDPYSLPANASSSDVKSSINDYGSAQDARRALAMDAHNSRYGSKLHKMRALSRAPPTGDQLDFQSSRLRSKSSCQVHEQAVKASRYNHSSSIYSPGHMLIPPTIAGDPVPPKLPPRRDLGARRAKFKSSSSVYNQDQEQRDFLNHDDENIYSTGLGATNGQAPNEASKVRKSKRNRFLESLKAPLELAKGGNRSNSSSVDVPELNPSVEDSNKTGAKSKGFAKSGSRNLRSLLGVKGKTKDNNLANNLDEQANYEQTPAGEILNKATVLQDSSSKEAPSRADGAEIDSAVDSNEDLDERLDSQQQQQPAAVAKLSSSNSFNDLDIPTPDYETDENIYALDETNYEAGEAQVSRRAGGSSGNLQSKGSKQAGQTGGKSGARTQSRSSKYDLYYSGYRAHVPAKNMAPSGNPIGGRSVFAERVSKSGSLLEDNLCSVGAQKSHSRAPSLAKMSVLREPIYGSSNVLTSGGSRYRSASMQRYLPRLQGPAMRSAHSEMYQELELENPYAIGGPTVGGSVHDVYYGYNTGTPAGAQRRSSKKNSAIQASLYGINTCMGSTLQRSGACAAISNYDIGRSSSGIYGINSSSSSSDYADWQPQIRKVNSSGYLNSIFKNHRSSPIETFATHQPLNSSASKTNHNSNNNQANNSATGSNNGSQLAALKGVYNNKSAGNNHNNNNNNNIKQPLLHKNQQTSRTFRSSRQASSVSKQVQQSQASNEPAFRSYDSSNGKLIFCLTPAVDAFM